MLNRDAVLSTGNAKMFSAIVGLLRAEGYEVDEMAAPPARPLAPTGNGAEGSVILGAFIKEGEARR